MTDRLTTEHNVVDFVKRLERRDHALAKMAEPVITISGPWWHVVRTIQMMPRGLVQYRERVQFVEDTAHQVIECTLHPM